MMRVLHVINTLDIGGAEALVLNLAKRIDRSAFALEVVSLGADGKLGDEFRALEVPTHALHRRSGIDPALGWRLRSLAAARKVQVLHSHNVGPWLYAGGAALSLRLPLVHTEHSNLFAHQRALMHAERALAYATRAVIADSEKVRRHLVQTQKLPAHKVQTVVNGIDTGVFAPNQASAPVRASLDLPADALVVGTVGRLVPVKDQATLLEAFARLAPEIPHARLLVVGEGPLRGTLEEQAKSLGVADRVRFAGGRRDVATLLPAFDVFALSSTSEGLPLTILEAMACGLPVVATQVGALNEAVAEDETGLLVPPANAQALAEGLQRLLLDAALRLKFGQAALARVQSRFDLGLMTRRYEEIYQAL